jgi:NADPH:quinone reductase-like Zn-dependent oxidoreductase
MHGATQTTGSQATKGREATAGRPAPETTTAPPTDATTTPATEATTSREATMRAVVQDTYGPAEVLQLRSIAKPVPDDNEVLVRVDAAGLDRGVWHVMAGLPYLVRVVVPSMGLRRPKVPVRGMDLAGRVEAAGKDVTRFRPGDAVFGWTDNGSFAEYTTAPEDHFASKPGALSFEQAAAVPISGLAALQAVRDVGEVQPGQRVLVLGAAGGVGSFAVQIAKAFGAHVTGVGSTSQADLVRSIGADDFVDYTRDDVTDGTRHWDVIIDTAGHRSLTRLRRALTPKGTLVIVGSEGRGRLMGGFDRSLRAVALSRFVPQRLRMLSSKPRLDDLETLRELIEAGKVTAEIDRTFPLPEAPKAVRYLDRRRTGGKVVISV